jgi:hypothetical protein
VTHITEADMAPHVNLNLIVAVHRALKSAIACSRVAEYP